MQLLQSVQSELNLREGELENARFEDKTRFFFFFVDNVGQISDFEVVFTHEVLVEREDIPRFDGLNTKVQERQALFLLRLLDFESIDHLYFLLRCNRLLLLPHFLQVQNL